MNALKLLNVLFLMKIIYELLFIAFNTLVSKWQTNIIIITIV